MAPISKGLVSRPHSNSQAINTSTTQDPPPSTLAANLVSNLPNARRPARTDEQEEFQRLLRDISQANGDVEALGGQERLIHHHKLIYVIAKAVLGPLSKDDSHGLSQTIPNQQAQHALESLEIIAATIKETPDVLAYVPTHTARVQTSFRLPLWIWLFSKILSLLGRPGCNRLQAKVRELVITCFISASRDPRACELTASFFCYFRHCIQGLLETVQASHSTSFDSNASLNLVLPPAAIEEELLIPGDSSPDIEGCTYTITSSIFALKHASILISIILEWTVNSAGTLDRVSTLSPYLTWIVEATHTICELGTTLPIAGRNRSDISITQVLNVDAIASLLSKPGKDISPSIKRKCLRLLIALSTTILRESNAPLSSTSSSARTIFLILHTIANACKEECNGGLLQDHAFQSVLDTVVKRLSLDVEYVDLVTVTYRLLKQINTAHTMCAATKLHNQASFLSHDEDRHTTKKRKINDNINIESNLELYCRHNLSPLINMESDNFPKTLDFAHALVTYYTSTADDMTRCAIFRYLQNFVCHCHSDKGYDLPELEDTISCRLCVHSTVELYTNHTTMDLLKEILSLMETIVGTPEFETSRNPRVQAMRALTTFVQHALGWEVQDLEKSFLGQWCLKSLQSSMRQLRIAAGRTLPVFLSNYVEDHVKVRNATHAFQLLKEISDSCPDQQKETCIMALGQLGRTADEHQLGIVLQQLTEYLNSSNQLFSSVAHNELISLAEKSDISVMQMLTPYWRKIGPMIVKNLQTRPQAAQMLADSMGMRVTRVLCLIQSYTLPTLMLEKRKDLIIKISQARGDNDFNDPWRLCFENSNIAPIMATLLVSNITTENADKDLEPLVLGFFLAVSSHFAGLDLNDLLRLYPIGIAVEILKLAGEADGSTKVKARHALRFLCSRDLSPKFEATYSQPKKPLAMNNVGIFFERYALGMMAHFLDTLSDARLPQSSTEQKRSLRGIEEMLKSGRSHVRTAIPQIGASLQSALSNHSTREVAFSVWATMLRSIDDDDAGLLLETTFTIMITQWPHFTQRSRSDASNLLHYLLERRPSLVQEWIHSLPSLGQIDYLKQVEASLSTLREESDVRKIFGNFSSRLAHEHASVVQQALVELAAFLRQHQETLQMAANSDQPDPLLQSLLRSILDACVRYNGGNNDIARLSAVCLGLIGCVDANRIHANREVREIIVKSNFTDPGESTDFVLFILEEVLVKAFMSTVQPKAQGMLGFAIQELLERCDFATVVSIHRRDPVAPDTLLLWEKWLTMSEATRMTLDPFLRSKYVVTETKPIAIEWPIFPGAKKYSNWLRTFVLDLLQRPNNNNAELVFTPLCRVVRIEDTSVAEFMLPYAALHAVLLGTEQQRYDIQAEIMVVLEHDISSDSSSAAATTKSCSEAIFKVLDYMTKWISMKQLTLHRMKRYEYDAGKVKELVSSIKLATELVDSIPAELISSRAVECNSYTRALFHWEQHIRAIKKEHGIPMNADPYMLQRLQDIYAQIDEPDGIEGISAHLSLDIDQQIVSHRRNGRWAAAQSWYEIQLAEEPGNVDIQVNLLQCLKESGQHDVLLNFVEGMDRSSSGITKLLPFATEAAWMTGRWKLLRKYTDMVPLDIGGDFNINLARILSHLHANDHAQLTSSIESLRHHLATSLSLASTTSLTSCHESMFKLHVLSELEMLLETPSEKEGKYQMLDSLERRLEVLGAYRADKQYLLGVRRAAMELSPTKFSKMNIASAWLTSARLARKSNAMHQSFNAVLHASKLGDASATIEHARLLWKGGNSRKAIQSLEQAIASNAFILFDERAVDSANATTETSVEHQNMLAARAYLLLAKWQDSAGQTHSAALRSQYQQAAKLYMTWEKGHYYLGRHYNKLIEAEKSLPVDQQSQQYLSGEMAKLVVENYLRSLNYGVKYLYQTLPRILTLWLDLGNQVMSVPDAKAGNREWQHNMLEMRKEQLKALHAKLVKYMTRTPSFIFYTALPQIMARIAHPNQEVFKYLRQLILKVMQSYPQQSLWSLFAVCASNVDSRKLRGQDMLVALRSSKKSETTYDLKAIIQIGDLLSKDLLMVCTSGKFEGNRTQTVSLSKDLGFNQKRNTPSQLVVPMESTLTATLPTLTDKLSKHKAFTQDAVTISSFLDEVQVLSSLQKPRKLMCRGSNGKLYGLMCKPKDDLRKDQRLMEFNSMINRMFKRDPESTRRQLYIKTYAVVPLNEDCGLIEWVDGLKTLREILLGLLKEIGIQPNYTDIKAVLDEALSAPGKLNEWYERLLQQYPAVFHLWFVRQFPDPSVWFAARLRYTRSCAVMSMVGTILGLGDRHGENILFEEGTGGTFHVDFNCLFDKGQTFAQPERVPFRLTHNMVDAMGPYGYEGPFRKCSELTIALLRGNEETLMVIMEAFVHDPTLDLMKKNGRGRGRRMLDENPGPPDNPQGVLDAIRRKTRGLLAGESVPLGIEGQVDELIKMAVSPLNLTNMYIGWCAFL